MGINKTSYTTAIENNNNKKLTLDEEINRLNTLKYNLQNNNVK